MSLTDERSVRIAKSFKDFTAKINFNKSSSNRADADLREMPISGTINRITAHTHGSQLTIHATRPFTVT